MELIALQHLLHMLLQSLSAGRCSIEQLNIFDSLHDNFRCVLVNLPVGFFRCNFACEPCCLSLINYDIAGRFNSKNIILREKGYNRVRNSLLPFILIAGQGSVCIFRSTEQHYATKVQIISLKNGCKIRSIAFYAVFKIIRISKRINKAAVFIQSKVFFQKGHKRFFYFRIIKIVAEKHADALVCDMPFLRCKLQGRLLCVIQSKLNAVGIIGFLIFFTAAEKYKCHKGKCCGG